jgi:tRNA A37 threonylcarbamoyladenosine dehydratase
MGFGSSTCVTASFGFVAAARAIQKLLERQTK